MSHPTHTHTYTQAHRRDQAGLIRARMALRSASTFSDACRDGFSSFGAGPRASAAASVAERLSALFATLHKSGSKEWRATGAPTGALHRGAPSRRTSLGGSSASYTISRRASTARASAAGLAEIMRRSSGCDGTSCSGDGDGPLSRSLSMTRQHSVVAAEAAQIVGKALDRVVEGDREGPSPAPGASPLPRGSPFMQRQHQQPHPKDDGVQQGSSTLADGLGPCEVRSSAVLDSQHCCARMLVLHATFAEVPWWH